MIKIIKDLVLKKAKAFELGTKSMDQLKLEFQNYKQNLSGQNNQYANNFIGINPIEISNFIYNNSNFYEYLKYTFLANEYDKKINTIQIAIIIAAVLLGVLLFFILPLIVFIIIVILLIIGLVVIFSKLKTGESYKSYYERTMEDLIMNSFNNITFDMKAKNQLLDTDIKEIFQNTYTNKIIRNNIGFTGNLVSGNICGLKLERETQSTDSKGQTSTSTTTVLDGFYSKIVLNNKFDKLKDNKIKIIADESLFSSLTEDTIKSIHESQKEFNFNSEEMNKSFDCKVSGYNGFNSIDEMLLEVQKIITPSFEQHLLYLRDRYNSFNMNISDYGMTFCVNMNRSLFQKLKHKEEFNLQQSYREATKDFRALSKSGGIQDFVYYNVFPFIERLYLINYLSYLYLSYMNTENYYNLNSQTITSFEEQMKNIYTQSYKDFKELYTDRIKETQKQGIEMSKSFQAN